MDVDFWLESEHVEPLIDDFCNVRVTVVTGEAYALDVWTSAYFEVARREGEESASGKTADRYILLPDLLVADLTRATLDSVVKNLLDTGATPPGCLVMMTKIPDGGRECHLTAPAGVPGQAPATVASTEVVYETEGEGVSA